MCGTASGWAKMALACLVVGAVLHIAGWASTSWMIYKLDPNVGVFEAEIGLWRQEICNLNGCNETATEDSFVTDEFKAVRGLETITFCLALFGSILLAIFVFIEWARVHILAVVLMVLCYIAGFCSMIAMVIMMVTVPDPFILSYSLGLTVLGFLLIFMAATMLIPDVFEPKDPYERSLDITTSSNRPPASRDVVTPRSIGYNDGGMFW